MRSGHRIRGLKAIGVDEIAYRAGHRYAILVYGMVRSRVVWVGTDKGRETLDRFFREALSAGQAAPIETACCDMSTAYIGALGAHCLNAPWCSIASTSSRP